MNFKQFTALYWAVTMFMPLILWFTKGWDYQLTWWTIFVTLIYIGACIKEAHSKGK